MPEDAVRQRPALGAQRSSSSHRHLRASNNNNDASSDSTANTPPTHHKAKAPKAHHVARAGLHARNLSYGKLHKPKAHAPEPNKRHVVSPPTSPTSQPIKRVGSEGRISAAGSTTNLRTQVPQAALKRNRSTADVRRPKSSIHLKRSQSQTKVQLDKAARTSVHFDLGNDGHDDEEEVEVDGDGDGDGWTEASGSASPSVSRSASRQGSIASGRSSARPNASEDNSQAQSPAHSPSKADMTKNWPANKQTTTPDAHQITSRLLQRAPSHNAPPQMSEISATASPAGGTPSSNPYFKNIPMGNETPRTPYTPHSSKTPVVSRFVGETDGTPAEASTLSQHSPKDQQRELDVARKVKSMGNLSQPEGQQPASDEDRPLAPRSRKGSSNAYVPPQQSRTQQKLWLQRASSNMESQQLAAANAPISVNGFPAMAVNVNPLVGAGYDGRDPRVKIQLEKTGMEYLVVRRYQDPVGRALRRLVKLPGNERMRRIPASTRSKSSASDQASVRYGLSQSMKERGKDSAPSISGARSTFEGSPNGSEGSGLADEEDGGLAIMLRSMWEKTGPEPASLE